MTDERTTKAVPLPPPTAKDETDRDVDPKEKLIDNICRLWKIETVAGKEFLRIALDNTVLMDKKQRDYGPYNISGFGMFGVIVRMNDKFERIKHLFENRRRRATNESIRDSLKDISNYAIIAVMLDSGKWPDK